MTATVQLIEPVRESGTSPEMVRDCSNRRWSWLKTSFAIVLGFVLFVPFVLFGVLAGVVAEHGEGEMVDDPIVKREW